MPGGRAEPLARGERGPLTTGVSSKLTEVSSELAEVSSDLTGVSSALTGVRDKLTGVSCKLTGVSSELTGVSSKLLGHSPLFYITGRMKIMSYYSWYALPYIPMALYFSKRSKPPLYYPSANFFILIFFLNMYGTL
jgi:hypothetical protein